MIKQPKINDQLKKDNKLLKEKNKVLTQLTENILLIYNNSKNQLLRINKLEQQRDED